MNAKELYYLYFHFKRLEKRNERLAKKTPGMRLSSLTAMFKEYYQFSLNDRDQAKFDLITRYWDKTSVQLKYEHKKLKEKGAAQGEDNLKKIIYAKNPLLDLISSSSEPWFGKYVPVPISYGAAAT